MFLKKLGEPHESEWKPGSDNTEGKTMPNANFEKVLLYLTEYKMSDQNKRW